MYPKFASGDVNLALTHSVNRSNFFRRSHVDARHVSFISLRRYTPADQPSVSRRSKWWRSRQAQSFQWDAWCRRPRPQRIALHRRHGGVQAPSSACPPKAEAQTDPRRCIVPTVPMPERLARHTEATPSSAAALYRTIACAAPTIPCSSIRSRSSMPRSWHPGRPARARTCASVRCRSKRQPRRRIQWLFSNT